MACHADLESLIKTNLFFYKFPWLASAQPQYPSTIADDYQFFPMIAKSIADLPDLQKILKTEFTPHSFSS